MARLVLIFIAVALLAHVSCKTEFHSIWVLQKYRNSLPQFTFAHRQKREEEATTQNILDSIKTGIEDTFSEQNMKKIVDGANDLSDKIKDIGGKLFDGVKGIFNTETPETTSKP